MEYNFKFTLTEDEYAEYNAYTVWSAPWQKNIRLRFLINMIAYCFAFAILGISVSETIRVNARTLSLVNNHMMTEAIIVSIIIALIMYFTSIQRIKSKAKRLVSKEENSQMLADRNLVVDDDRIFYSTSKSQSIYSWDSIIRCVVTKYSFYLYLNSMQAIIVPKRLFKSQHEIEEFDKFITEKIPLSSSFRSMGI